jgi:hypothetical protein
VITIAPDRYGELRIVFMIRDSRDYFAYRLGPGYLYLRANLNNEHHKQALDRLRSESDKEDGLVHLLPFKEDY